MTPRRTPPLEISTEQAERTRLITEAVDRKIASDDLTDYERFLKSIGQLRPYLISRALRRG